MGHCYVIELCNQLELFGTETNTLTRQMVKDEIEKVLNKINKTLA